MKHLALLLCTVLALSLRADDTTDSSGAPPPLLANGDFSEGLSHWDGAVKSPPDSPDGSPGKGAGISLGDTDWSLATHQFELPAGRYKLLISFTILPDTKFSSKITDYTNLKERLGIPDVQHYLEAQPGQWVTAIIDSTDNTYLWWRSKPSPATGKQACTFTIENLDFKNRQTLELAFPPGSGEVVLQNVSILPAAAGQN